MNTTVDNHQTFERFKTELKGLVEKFEKNQREYRQSDYVEARLRDDFLNPLFRALGWDTENNRSLIQMDREVEIESTTRVGHARKRADYLFRTDKVDRFVCEAKKPFESLHSRHAFQAKRYAWNKGVPLAILTHFAELTIYLVGTKPRIDDDVDIGRWKSWHFSTFTDDAVAQEIWDLLSRSRVAAGGIDEALQALPKKATTGKGRARQLWLIKPDRSRSLDYDFLAFLDTTRRDLASDIYKRNDHSQLLDNRLTEACQRIIDRILFLRICEDRDIDTGEPLARIVEQWRRQFGAGQAPEGTLWSEVVNHFRGLDHRPPSHVPFFNGNLFKQHFTETLVIGNEWLADFIGDLSDDESPYLFNVIPVEILGSVYERFLGNIVRPAGRGITVEQKPEVRKAGGVYYTPRYIVDYIVEQTVGTLLDAIAAAKDTTSLKAFSAQTEQLRLLDPACGSGSFLIRVFERVCEHWLKRLNAELPSWSQKVKRKAWEANHQHICWLDADTGDIHLTVAHKRKILTDNVYGVDLDAGAVEVTQLSLYLKMLENEDRMTLKRQRELLSTASNVALLPPLQDNIKCGNSLIASDFSMLPEDLIRVHAFDWPVQFATVMRSGGFDAVVGNPPWIDIKGFDPTQTHYFFKTYSTVENRMNVYAIFMHRAMELLKLKGYLGLITPNSFLTQSSYEKLRHQLLTHQIAAVVRTPDNVFDGVTAETAISIYRKAKSSQKIQTLVYPAAAVIDRIALDNGGKQLSIHPSAWLKSSSCIFNLHQTAGINVLLTRVEAAGTPLLDVCEFCLGLTPYDKARGHSRAQIEGRVFHSTYPKDDAWKMLLEGRDIQRFAVQESGTEYIHYGPWLGAARDQRFFTEPRIVVRQIISGKPGRIYAAYTDSELYNTQIAFNLVLRAAGKEKLKYLLGIVNSQLMTWFHRQRFLDPNKITFQKILIQDAKLFPIRRIDFKQPLDKSRHNKMVLLVDKMMSLTPKLRDASSDAEKSVLLNAITATDQQIDALVYELYGLSSGDIALVEGRI